MVRENEKKLDKIIKLLEQQEEKNELWAQYKTVRAFVWKVFRGRHDR
jgi:hypothetical protein